MSIFRWLRFLWRHKWKTALSVIFLFLIAATGFIVYQGKQLASPDRKEPQDYHQRWIDAAAENGINIRSLDCIEAKVPALVIEPVATETLGKRGSKLRAELSERNIQLPPQGSIIGNIVILHGRKGCKEDMISVAMRFCAVGFRCILIDMPAHGKSKLNTTTFGANEAEQDIPYQVLTECAEHFQFSPENASLWGMSMGGSFANSACADPQHGTHWKSLIIVCSFDNLFNVIRNQTHANWIAKLVSKVYCNNGGIPLEKIAPQLWVQSVHTPVMMVHGDNDTVIPIELGKTLYGSYASKDKKWITIKNAGHSDLLTTPDPTYAEMAIWLLAHIK